MPRPKIRADRHEAIEWLVDQNSKSGDECFDFIFDAPTIRFMDKPRSPQWIMCTLTNGVADPDKHPVQTCKTAGCINGKHRRWGSYSEMMASRVFPSRAGGDNPMSKFTDLEVSQLRSIDWGNGRFKRQVAEIYGVSPMTLHSIITGKGWQHVTPYVSKSSVKGDEF